jgi:hypothetical protein
MNSPAPEEERGAGLPPARYFVETVRAAGLGAKMSSRYCGGNRQICGGFLSYPVCGRSRVFGPAGHGGLIHDDEAARRQMLDKPLPHDLRHEFVHVVKARRRCPALGANPHPVGLRLGADASGGGAVVFGG